MLKLNKKKYVGFLLILILVICIIGITILSKHDKFKGLVKVKNAKVLTSVGNTSLTTSKGYDFVNYSLSYTLDNVEGITKRDVIIKATLNDQDSVYARFKEFNDSKYTTVLSDNGKSIEVTGHDITLGEEQNLSLLLVIENAPNGVSITPKIQIKEATGTYTNINTQSIKVETNSVEGYVRDENLMSVSNIELSISKNGREIKRTYTNSEGRFIFTDLTPDNYEIKVEEDIYELLGNNKIQVQNSSNINLSVRQVESYNIKTKKYISKLKLVVNGKEKNYNYGEVEKVVQSIEKAKTISGEIEYKIVVQNKGEKPGIVTRVIDEVEPGLTFETSKNSGWEEVDGNLLYRPIEGVSLSKNAKREIKLVLTINNTEEIKTYLNKVTSKGELYEHVVFVLEDEVIKEEDVIEGEYIKEPTTSEENIGWYTDKNYTNKYNFKNSVTKNLILYSKIKPLDIDHTVTFVDKNPETSDETNYEIKTVHDRDKVTRPETDPSYTGYTFKCWAVNNECFDFNTDIKQDTVLESKYTINKYTVLFINNGEEYARREVNYKNQIPSVDEPSVEYFTFTHWSLTDGGDEYNLDTPVTGDITLYAVYTRENYTVNIIDKNPQTSEEVVIDTQTVAKGNKATRPATDPTKTGYTFECYQDINSTDCYNFNSPVSENMTLVTKYNINKYSVTFINNGTEYKKQEIEYMGLIEAPVNPFKEFFTFKYWSLEENGTEYDITTPVTNNVTLYSVYEKDTYNVKFIDDGRIIRDEDVDAGTLITAETVSKEGYTFKYWTEDGDNAFDFSNPITNSIILNSVYEIINYSINYDLDGGSLPDGIVNPDKYTIISEPITLNNPSKEGYTFIGWTDDNSQTPDTNYVINTGSTGNKNIKANYEKINYTITYNLNGGSLSDGQDNPTKYTVETEKITLNNPSKEGYTFIGWTGSNGTTPETSVSISKGSTGNKEYVANYEAVEYTITYKGLTNDEKTALNNPETYTIESNNIVLNNPSNRVDTDGDLTEIFIGWKENESTSINITIETGSTGNKEYEAIWQTADEDVYTITYNLNGGTLETENPTSFTKKTNTFTLNNPSKEGYTFIGWTGSNGTTPETNVSVTKGTRENLSFTANYTEIEYTIEYDLKGGVLETANPTSYTITSPSFTLNNPSKTGYTFVGWEGTDLSTENISVTIEQGSIGNRSYVAKYTKNNYTITYNLNGGTVSEENPNSYTVTDTFTLNNPSKEGYTFTGWSGTGLVELTNEVTVPVGNIGNREYTANYTPINYTITYDLDGGTVTEANPESYNIETPTITLNNPTKQGYSFRGWIVNNDDTPDKDYTIQTGSTGNISLKAVYGATEYTITYDLNGGTVTESNPETYTAETETFTLNNPSKEGYTFTGWTGNGISVPTLTISIEKGSYGHKSFVANYTPTLYTITYDLNDGSLGEGVTNPITYTIETPTFTLNNPSKEGHTFSGWTGTNITSPTTEVIIDTGSTGNREYTANYDTIKYTVKFWTKLSSGWTTLKVINDVEYGSTITPPTTNPTKTGYTFKYWSLNDYIDEEYDITQPITRNLDLYPIFERNQYTITYDYNGGTLPEGVTNVESYNVETPTFAIHEPSKEGYTFIGWTGSHSAEPRTNISIYKGSVGNRIYNANYEIKKYTVTFMNGNSIFRSSIVEHGSKVEVPDAIPSKIHSVFSKWVDENGIEYNFDTPVTGNLILYAEYKEVESPSISHTPIEWTNDKVTVTITNKGTDGVDYTGYSYMYKIDDGDYQSYTSPFDVSINSTVYAYSVENEITSVEELDEISNIDKINPEIKDVESVSVSKNSVTLSITSRDNESGLGSLNIYKNSVLETTIGITDSVSEDKIIQYTVENLDPNTEYTFNVTATDLAGNVSEQGTITITTSEAEIIRLQVIGTNNTLFDDPSQYIEFESFSDLLSSQECSSNQCTVKVVEDVVESVTLLDGQDITVDLNGHNVSSLTENTFEVLGDLTIIDSGSTEGSIKNTVGTAILVSNGGTLTIGEDDADVSITKPYIEGNTYGIKNNGGTVNFYDGKVKASNAISGTVSDTPDGYTASVEKITDGEDVYQVGTLQILSDVEARIGNVYYTTIDEAVNDSKSGSYQDNMSTGNIMDLMKPIGTNTFLYNELEEAYISTNEGQTDATVYTVLDLTNETVVKDLYLKGYLISDLDPELYHFDSANLIVKQGNSSGTTVCTKSFVYAKETVNSCVLTPGSRYYVEINYKKANLYQGAQYANDKFAIKEISLKTYETVSVPEIDSANLVTEYKGLYGFDYDPETRTLRSNNQYTKNTKAYSYMEVDLTNKTGNYDLIINATLDTYGSYNYGDVVVSTSLEEATSYNYNNFIHMNGKSSTPSLVGPYNHTKTLAGGSKYYIQFYYFKDSDYFNDTSDHTAAEYEAIGVKDQFIINSIDLVKVDTENTTNALNLQTADQYGFTHYATGYYEGYDPENITQGTYADSYVEIDLTDAEYDQELDAYLYLYSGSNQKYFYITSNNKNANYNNIKSNRDKSILFYDYNISYNYYVDGSSKESNFSNYKYILQKGNKYYVHFAVNGTQTSSSDFPHIRSITLKPVTESLLNIGSLNNSEGTLGGLTLDDRLIDAYGDLRFITKNPNNYVTFNNEPWRIIGVFSVEGEDGTKEDRIKITRDTALPQGPVYDSTPVNLSGTPVNGGQGINEWSQADLMKLLNPGYDSNEEETFNYDPDTYTYSSAGNKLMDNSLYWNKASGFCTTGTYNSYTSCDYSSIGLTSEAKSFIDTVKWNTGAVPYNQQRTVYQLYEAERGNNTTKSSTWVTQGVDDDVERQTTWIGKVGLPYLSDYLMATGPFYSNGSLIFNYEQCLNTNGGQGACTSSNDWLASITGPMAVMNSVYGQNASGYDSYLSYVAFPATTYSGGMPAASMYYQVKPTVYLKTNTVISSGTGSSTDPYILTLGDSKNTASYYGLNELPEGSEEEPNIITPETPTDDYTKVTNRTLYGFEYNSSTNTFTNANAGVPSSTAYSYTTIDLTDATEDLTFDLRYGAICASSSYNSCYYAIAFTDKLATINFDNSSVISGGSDAFLTYESGSSSSSTYSMNPREITLPKGKKYYMQLGFRNKTNNPGQVLWISMTKKNYTATETEATAYNGTVPVVNQEPDTIVVLKNIDRTSPVSIPATKNVTIDLNGYKISSNQGQGTITKYSHTPNINDSGVASGTYASNLSRTDTVTIPGASKLNIEVWFSTESISYDWLAIYPKNVTPSYSNYSQATISGGKLGGGKMTSKPTLSSYHRTYTVNDNSVKFYFRSDGGGNYYGYYAIISAPGEPGYVFDNAGELTIIDSSDSKTGTLESTGYHTINNQSTGNLNIESATVKQTSTYSAVNNDGKLRIGSGGELIAINTIVNNLEHGDILDGEGTFTRDPSANESNNSVAISNASTVETGFSGYTFNMNTYGSYNVSTVFNTTINDKKITFGDITSTSAMFTNASNIEINDSNIDARSSAFGTINNLTINGSQLSSNVSLSTNGTASINDTTITGTFTTLGNTTTEMTDTIITKTISNAGELSINGGEVQCANISYEPNRVAFTNGGTLTIDGEFTTGDSCITGIKNYGTTTIGNKEDNTVSTEYPNIKGTNYGINNIKTESNHTYDGLLNFYDGAISGKENQAISGSINDIQSGYEIVKTVEGTIETITLGEADYVCQIGETKFRSLNLAVDSITGSEETTIKIIRDFTAAEKTIIPEGKNVIVDFDGHVVSSYCDTMFENAGTLSLTDNNSTPSEHTFNGTLFIKNNGTFNYDKTTINFYGKFIENNGTFNMNGGNVNFYNSYQFINNNGNIIINDGNIDFRLTTSSSSSISLISNNENSSITINDVTLGSSTTYGYSQTIISNNSTLIINDGNYNLSRFGYFITNSNTLDVNGGNFTGIRSFIVNNNIEGATANIKNIVSDGTAEFKDNYGTINLEGNTITNISEYTGYYPTNRSNSAILNVKDCNYTKKPDENGYNYYSSIIVSKGTAVFENTTTDGSISVKTGNLEIKSGSYSTITASNSETGSIIPSLKITGGTITAPSNTVAVSIANTFTGTVQIGEKDGTVDVDSPIITGSSAISASNTSGFNFYDGTLIGKKNQASVGTIVDIETDYDVITDSIDAETDMQYLGTDSLVVNTRTNIEYRSLQTAIDTAENGDTLKLLRSLVTTSTSPKYVVEADKDITLDMDGFAINKNNSDVLFENNGKLKINPNSETHSESEYITKPGEYKIDALDYIRGIKSAGTYNYNPKPDQEHLGLKFVDGLVQGKRTYMPSGIPTSFMTENQTMTIDVTFTPQKTSNMMVISNKQAGGCAIGITDKKVAGRCFIDGMERIIKTNYEIETDHMYNAVLTFDGKYLKFYVNGTIVGTFESDLDSTTIKTPTNNTAFMIGAEPKGSTPEGSYFEGYVHLVKVSPGVLTSEEINTNYQVTNYRYNVTNKGSINNFTTESTFVNSGELDIGSISFTKSRGNATEFINNENSKLNIDYIYLAGSTDRVNDYTYTYISCNLLQNSGEATIKEGSINGLIQNNSTGDLILDNIDFKTSITNAGTLTINGGLYGATLTNTGETKIHDTNNIVEFKGTILNSGSSQMTIDNIKLVQGTNNTPLEIADTSNLIINNGTFVRSEVNAATSIVIKASGNSTATINNASADSTVIYNGTIHLGYKEDHIISAVDSSNITINNIEWYYLSLSDTANMTLVNGTINSGVGVGAGSTFTMGEDDSSVSTTKPKINGTLSNNGTFNFYDGVIKGLVKEEDYYGCSYSTPYQTQTNFSGPMTGTGTVNTPSNYELATTESVDQTDDCSKKLYYNSIYLANTYSVRNLSTGVKYNKLSTAFAEVEDGEELRLMKPLTLLASEETAELASGKDVILDLNGYSIRHSNSLITNNGILTIVDNSDEEIGEISNQLTNPSITNNGTLYIDGGRYSGGNNIVNNGTMKFTHGTIILGDNNIVNNSDLSIMGGTMTPQNGNYYNKNTSGSSIVNSSTGNLDISSGTINAKFWISKPSNSYVIHNLIDNSGSLNITGGNFVFGNYTSHEFGELELRFINNNINATTTITGGTFSNFVYYNSIKPSGLFINNLGEADISNISINNSNISYNEGTLIMSNISSNQTLSSVQSPSLFTNASGTTTVNSSTIVDNNTLANVTGGTLNINNSTITGTGSGIKGTNSGTTNLTNNTITLDGTIATGSIINIYSGDYTSNDSSNAAIEVTELNITGGTLTSTNGTAIKITSGSTVNIGISGSPVDTTSPVIKGFKYGVSNNSGILNFYDGVIKGIDGSITGIISNVEGGYETETFTDTDNYESKRLKIIGTATNTFSVNGVNYGDLQSAVNAVPENVETNIILNTNYTLTENIVVPMNVTINLYLNGNTLNYDVYSITGDGTLNVKDETYSGVGGAIYKFLANLIGVDLNKKNITIYQMEDGSSLSSSKLYTLYKLVNNEYITVKVNENGIGNYDIGNKTNELRAIKGIIYVNNIGEGQYKLKGSDNKEINFEITSTGLSSNIRENIKTTSNNNYDTAIATLILTIQTGITRIPYKFIISIVIISLVTVFILKIKKKEN